MKISYAQGIIEILDYSNYNDYENMYPNSYYSCHKCGEKIKFSINDLDQHRFSKVSNLQKKDKRDADTLILSMIPKYKLNQRRQIWALTNRDRILVMLQRIWIGFKAVNGFSLPVPKTTENIPDSFIDYYCSKCQSPVRIYYCSFLGGRQAEISYRIKYILN
jgi:hypothetical protein